MGDVITPHAFSPLQKYFADVDAKHYDKPYGWFYYHFANKVPSEWLTQQLISDMEFRANHQGNFLGVINSSQGSGKSLFGVSLCLWLGIKFGVPFDLKRDIFVNPFELDLEIRNPNKDKRRTFMQDEQPKGTAGLGSGLLVRSLKDYEELGRFSQKNFVYIAPSEREHKAYFTFSEYDYELNRIERAECKVCPKLFECKKNQLDTMCDLKFWERDGFPRSIRFMLFTKRLSDNMDIPRGLITFPMPTPATMVGYDSIKRNNLQKFEAYENDAWKKKIREIEAFVEEYADKLISKKVTNKGVRFKVGGKELIESYFYDFFSSGRFTRDEVGIFIARAKSILEQKADILNKGGEEEVLE